jgi:predicted N-formylglutamate amidohydrolase
LLGAAPSREDFERIRGAAVHVTPARGGPPVILLCEHASYVIPAPWNDLGLPAAHRLEHISWDPGAAAVALRIANLLGVAAVLAGYSRLFADCNRHPHLASFVCESSDGIRIPGNRGLSAEDRRFRELLAFAPYQEAVAELIEEGFDTTLRPLLISIHSFVPAMEGVYRPWHLGILWRDSETVARSFIGKLRDYALLPDGSTPHIGENEPYSGRAYLGYTLETYAARGLDTVCVEMRHDTLATVGDIEHWSRLLAGAIETIVAI